MYMRKREVKRERERERESSKGQRPDDPKKPNKWKAIKENLPGPYQGKVKA